MDAPKNQISLFSETIESLLARRGLADERGLREAWDRLSAFRPTPFERVITAKFIFQSELTTIKSLWIFKHLNELRKMARASQPEPKSPVDVFKKTRSVLDISDNRITTPRKRNGSDTDFSGVDLQRNSPPLQKDESPPSDTEQSDKNALAVSLTFKEGVLLSGFHLSEPRSSANTPSNKSIENNISLTQKKFRDASPVDRYKKSAFQAAVATKAVTHTNQKSLILAKFFFGLLRRQLESVAECFDTWREVGRVLARHNLTLPQLTALLENHQQSSQEIRRRAASRLQSSGIQALIRAVGSARKRAIRGAWRAVLVLK